MHKKPIFDLLTKKLLLRKCLYPIDFQAIEEIATGYSTGKNTIQAVRKALLNEDIPCEDRLRDDHCLKRFLSLWAAPLARWRQYEYHHQKYKRQTQFLPA